MHEMKSMLMGVWLLAGLAAQGGGSEPQPAPKPVAASKADADEAPKLSIEARIALAKARELEQDCRGKVGAERSRALEVAASEYDRLVAEFAGEPRAAALAAWNGAEIWRRHGSVPLAEKDYLRAAEGDPVRYGQRGLLGAADMQRRQQRIEEALATYARAEAVDPRTSHAHWARIRVARLLRDGERIDDAIEKFQAALESAPGLQKQLETADELAKAWIQKGDLDSAGFVIDHARKLADGCDDPDPVVVERVRHGFETMGAHKALQRARDKQAETAKDAVRLDEHRRMTGK